MNGGQVGGAGTRVLKFRGGMTKQGAVRLFGAFRMGNSMALLDADLRGVPEDEAKGAGTWDSYSFHTDLPPGHPMVTGEQTNDPGSGQPHPPWPALAGAGPDGGGAP